MKFNQFYYFKSVDIFKYNHTNVFGLVQLIFNNFFFSLIGKQLAYITTKFKAYSLMVCYIYCEMIATLF